jgi:hypothetical protein
MKIRVDVQNYILGNGMFWEGDSRDIGQIRNIVARDLAVRVATDGETRTSGMWKVSEVKDVG